MLVLWRAVCLHSLVLAAAWILFLGLTLGHLRVHILFYSFLYLHSLVLDLKNSRNSINAC